MQYILRLLVVGAIIIGLPIFVYADSPQSGYGTQSRSTQDESHAANWNKNSHNSHSKSQEEQHENWHAQEHEHEHEKDTPPPTDTQPPVIAAHADVQVSLPHSNTITVAVTYTLPIATDNIDGTDPVSCLPTSGSLFTLGTTTVTCNAQDVAGNQATPTTFSVIVNPFVPQPVVLASQPNESVPCDTGWENCFTGGSNFLNINLGKGDSGALQNGALHDVTLSIEPAYAPLIPNDPFRITISCFTDPAETIPCTDWVQSNSHIGTSNHSYIFEDTLTTTDNQHWSALFTNPSNEANYNGSSPVVFNPAYYYQMQIAEHFVGWPMYGSATEPYWIVNGTTQ